MKKIITILILFSVAVCTLDECKREKDSTKCESHELEYDGFSCYSYTHESGDEKGCAGYPDDKDTQKIFFKFFNGVDKEINTQQIQSATLDPEGEEIVKYYYSLNETFEKGDTIVLKETILTDEEQKIDKKKTCSYLYYGRFIDLNMDDLIEGKTVKYDDIEDKTICFNAAQFPELKDLVDCGHAEIKFTVKDKEYKLKTCFYIPNDNMPTELQTYFKSQLIDPLFAKEGKFEFLSSFIEPSSEGSRRLSKSRKLQENNYEIVVEDKNGKKVKYSGSSDKIEVLEKGSNSNNDSNDRNVASTLIIAGLCICALFALIAIFSKCII